MTAAEQHALELFEAARRNAEVVSVQLAQASAQAAQAMHSIGVSLDSLKAALAQQQAEAEAKKEHDLAIADALAAAHYDAEAVNA